MRIYKITEVMRRFINLFALAATSAAMLHSCQVVEVHEEVPAGQEYVFAIGTADETKAALGSSVIWANGDKVGTFVGASNNKYSTVTAAAGDAPASISVYASGGLTIGDKIYCYYPYSSDAGVNKAEVTISVPVSQNEKDAMPMVSIPYTVEETSAETQTPYAGLIRFANLGAVMELNIYSDTPAYAEEKILSVEFNSDQAIAGSFTFDLTQVDYENAATLAISGYSEKSVVYTPSTELAVASTKANATIVNLVVAPGSYTGEIVVKTDKAIYTYPVSTAKEFKRSVAKPLGLNLRENVRSDYPVLAFAYTTEIKVGDEIIIASGNEESVSVMGEQTSNNRNAVENIDVQNGVIVSNNDMAVFTVGSSNGYFTFYDEVEAGYLYAASPSNNYLKTQSEVDANAEWSVSTTDGVTTVVASRSENRNHMRYNTSNTLFSCYAESSTMATVYIFKKTTETSIAATPSESTVSYEAGSSTLSYFVANPVGPTTVEGTNVTISSHDEANKTITFSYEANNTGNDRTLSISVTNNGKSKIVDITQKPAPTKLVMSQVTATPAETSISYSWSAVEGASGYEVKTTGDWTSVLGTSYTYTGLTASTTYTIQFRAVGDGLSYVTSDAVSSSATTTSAGSSIYFEKVSEIFVGQKYLLVAEYDGKFYAFNSSDVGQPTPAVDITQLVSNNTIPSTDATNTYSVTIEEGSEDNTYLIKLSDNTNYLKLNSSSLSEGSVGENLTVEEQDGKFLFVGTVNNKRSLMFRNGYNFRNYAKSNATSNGYCGYLTLYKLQNN